STAGAAAARRAAAAGEPGAVTSPSAERQGVGMKGSLKVALISAEMVPLAKVGGLGDVIGALSQVLSQAGQRTVVLLPHYKTLKTPPGFKLGTPITFPVLMRGGPETAVFTPASWRGLSGQVYLVG